MSREIITTRQRTNAEEYLAERAANAADFVAEKVHGTKLRKGKNLFPLPDNASGKPDVLLVIDKGWGSTPQIDTGLLHLFQGVSAPDTLIVKRGELSVKRLHQSGYRVTKHELSDGETLWIPRGIPFRHYPKEGKVGAALLMQARKRSF